MPKHKFNTAQFYANNSVSVHDRRRSSHLAATRDAPKNVRISKVQARGYTPKSRLRDAVVARSDSGISLSDAKQLMRPDLSVSTKQFAKNGLGVREVVTACPWDEKRYEK